LGDKQKIKARQIEERLLANPLSAASLVSNFQRAFFLQPGGKVKKSASPWKMQGKLSVSLKTFIFMRMLSGQQKS
jgi:hypothetical protein